MIDEYGNGNSRRGDRDRQLPIILILNNEMGMGFGSIQ
jgi:hypothetical protein